MYNNNNKYFLLQINTEFKNGTINYQKTTSALVLNIKIGFNLNLKHNISFFTMVSRNKTFFMIKGK